MSFAHDASKLLTNKYFLYFIVFLAATNILGYIVMHKLNAIIFFALVGIIMYNFSKNMSVILIVCMLATNLLLSNSFSREGMTNANDATMSTTSDNSKKSVDDTEDTVTDDKISKGIVAMKKNKTVSDAKASLSNQQDRPLDKDQGIISGPMDKVTDPNNPELAGSTEEAGAPEPMTNEFNNNGKPNKLGGKKGRIDYGATLEEAYDNLEKMLGSGGIKQLTEDTTVLMKRQKEMFDSMKTMEPMLNQAKQMLDGFDMGSLTKLANMAQSFTAGAPIVQK